MISRIVAVAARGLWIEHSGTTTLRRNGPRAHPPREPLRQTQHNTALRRSRLLNTLPKPPPRANCLQTNLVSFRMKKRSTRLFARLKCDGNALT